MKNFFEILPVLLFFAAYKGWDFFVATGVLMAATALQILVLQFMGKRPTKMQFTSTGLILLFGGVTLLLRDEVYLKWKVTVVNWIFGLVFLTSHFVGKQTIIQRILGQQITLPKKVFDQLNASWVFFFFFLGALNLYVFMFFETDVWVDFKLFGLFGLTLVFTLAQALYLSKKAHLK